MKTVSGQEFTHQGEPRNVLQLFQGRGKVLGEIEDPPLRIISCCGEGIRKSQGFSILPENPTKCAWCKHVECSLASPAPSATGEERNVYHSMKRVITQHNSPLNNGYSHFVSRSSAKLE